MSIEINRSAGRPAVEVADNHKTQARPAGNASSRSAGATGGAYGDKVSLTSEAAQLQALEDQVASLPVVDTQRVQEIQRSLATGSFQVDPAKVADKLLKFEAALGNNG